MYTPPLTLQKSPVLGILIISHAAYDGNTEKHLEGENENGKDNED